jgi:hypothetical protein
LEGAAFLLANFSFAQLIEAEVGDDAVQPSREAGIEAKLGQITVDAKEGFLVNVARVFFGVKQIVGHAQDVMIMSAHKFVESAGVATLGGTDKVDFGCTL